MNEFLTSIGPYLTSLVIALITYLVTVINTKKLKTKLADIEKAIMDSDQEYYVLCPNCEQKIILSKVKLYAQIKPEAPTIASTPNFKSRVKGITKTTCKICGATHNPQENCEEKGGK